MHAAREYQVSMLGITLSKPRAELANQRIREAGLAELSGFEVRDVENLREHYALTLRHWVRRLEAQHDEACSAADEVTCRVWRLYMARSAYRLEKGQINVYQTLLAKLDRGKARLPLTRADWYAQASE